MTDPSAEPRLQHSDARGLDITAADTSWGFKGRNYLFVIGIDDYQKWRPLSCAVKDVQDFTKVLIENYQFEQDNVFSLLNEEATAQNVLDLLRELAGKVTDQDNLLIYFSGHGHYDEVTESGYWIPVDAKTGNKNQYQFIDTAIIVDRLRKINSLHTFLIVDACFSGSILHSNKGETSPKSERHKARIVFASGRCEVVSDGPKGGNSPFAKGILDILRMNSDAFISASRLIVEAKEYVAKQVDQSPTDGRLHAADDQGGDFIFRLKMSEAENWASVVQLDTWRAYEKFIERFPDSKHLEEAREAYVWLQAKEKNTKQSLGSYLRDLNKSQPGGGKYMSLAIQALLVVEEQECWEEASKKDTLNAYFQYLSKFGSGHHAEEANSRIEKLLKDEDDVAFKKALEDDSLDAINEYLKNSKEKKYQEEAEKKLSAITFRQDQVSREESVWKETQEASTYIAYHDFIQAYPESRWLQEALKKMKIMDDVAWKEIQISEYDSNLSADEKIHLCHRYFDNFPGAENNLSVKQIKDQFEFEKYSENNNLLNLLDSARTGRPGGIRGIWLCIKNVFLRMLGRA